MNEVYDKLQNCLKSVREKTDFVPEVALILGSGLGDYVKEVSVSATIDYKEIEGFPISTVVGHKGRFIFGYVNEVPVVIMQGRVHYYEGYPISDVVLPTRLMGLLGAKTLFLTNACGGINEGFKAGDFMLLTDHIASFVPSPLMGENIDELGTRFPDMSDIYRKELRAIIKEIAKEEKIELKEGVYLQLSGPAYESPAEVRMCRILGADAVGMSTACEALAANHMGLKVCGISCITNMACGISKEPLSHKEVQQTADRVAPLFQKLVTASITRIAKKS
ncbi:purine-nucleoside phosphorylase [Clostridium sp. E02]|uniref:purine-nucleoside phosphorylase n=1 Tax=Clostridium sp. E02 TaxID=2487134 RepID=UPI000F530707|nr:purine-nucleoside phosphorylase [Clostridium sp. E02]